MQSMTQACRASVAQSTCSFRKQIKIHILDRKMNSFQCSHSPVVLVYPGSSSRNGVLFGFGFGFFFFFWLLLLFLYHSIHTIGEPNAFCTDVAEATSTSS